MSMITRVPLLYRTILAAVLIIGIIGGLGYFGYQYYYYSNPKRAAAREVEALMAKVSKLIELPSNEAPSIATITDTQKLPKQAFFSKAQVDDKLIVFSEAKKAILYRPSTDKVIEVGPVNIINPTPASATASKKLVDPTITVPTPTIAAPTTIAIYNGSGVQGLAAKTEKTILERLTSAKIVAKQNASTVDYKKAIVVDIAGNKKEFATEVASLLKAEVATLPQGEKKPEADILVIVIE